VPILCAPLGQRADFCVQHTSHAAYDYKYIEEKHALLFNYNACVETPGLPFANFNKAMFDFIADKKVKKIIVDLRRNSGGNSEVLNPFTKQLPEYLQKNPDTQVYILVGRDTFSSGIIAILKIMAVAPKAVSIGESTGGDLEDYGDTRSFNLPNSWLSVRYSTKYFDFNKQLKRPDQVTNAFIPDVEITPTIEDYRQKNDAVLNEAIK